MTTYMNSTISFQTDSLTYELSAGFDFDKNAYYMPSLSFIKNEGHIKNEVYIAFWDNEAYLIKTLYEKVLIPWNKHKAISNEEAFEDLLKIEGCTLADFVSLEKLIKLAIDKGFFYEYYNRN